MQQSRRHTRQGRRAGVGSNSPVHQTLGPPVKGVAHTVRQAAKLRTVQQRGHAVERRRRPPTNGRERQACKFA
eukprot:79696-Chlamydomonas_euryale.AAC.1